MCRPQLRKPVTLILALYWRPRVRSPPVEFRTAMIHPGFDPVAIHLGPLAVRWYGLMYVLGFVAALLLGKYRARNRPDLGWTEKDMDDVLMYGLFGVVLGGRLGYVIFYRPDYYFAHPVEIFSVWEGGMSFHGGMLGVLVALWLFARKTTRPWLAVTDFIAPLVPLGLGAGRIGNFINGELWGRPTELPWGMIFPRVDHIYRHPSQLYEFALEGVALFVLLWWFSSRPREVGRVSGMFLVGYGVFRFGVEFTREPDDFLGLLSLGLSMGQWLSLPMIGAGLWLLARRAGDASAKPPV
jgi:phosphatidylglycerol:prolipoprotein diacylglycerol transferase